MRFTLGNVTVSVFKIDAGRFQYIITDGIDTVESWDVTGDVFAGSAEEVADAVTAWHADILTGNAKDNATDAERRISERNAAAFGVTLANA